MSEKSLNLELDSIEYVSSFKTLFDSLKHCHTEEQNEKWTDVDGFPQLSFLPF